MSFFSITGTRERILWSSVQQLSVLSVKIQLHDDDQLYPASRVYKNQNLAAYLQWYKDQKKTKAQLTNKPEKEGAGHLVTEIDMLGSMPSSRRGIYRRRGRSHRLALDTRAGRAKGQLQLWAIPSWQVCGLQTDFLFLWMGAIFSPSTVLLRRPHQQILAMFA